MSAYVLTGATGAGKTVLLRALEVRGHLVVEEAATDVTALEHALGNDEPWTDPTFLDAIVRLQRLREPVAGFADRSPVCTLALCRYLGAVEPTPARRISLADSLVFERVHEETYRKLGFDLVDVPDGTLAERINTIEGALSTQVYPDAPAT